MHVSEWRATTYVSLILRTSPRMRTHPYFSWKARDKAVRGRRGRLLSSRSEERMRALHEWLLLIGRAGEAGDLAGHLVIQ
eukprot:5961658-Prymnesium_polylepis.1